MEINNKERNKRNTREFDIELGVLLNGIFYLCYGKVEHQVISKLLIGTKFQISKYDGHIPKASLPSLVPRVLEISSWIFFKAEKL